MKQIRIPIKNFLSSLVIGGMIFSFGNVAFAGEVKIQSIQEQQVCNHHQHDKQKTKWSPEKTKERIQKKLTILVKNGTLSQDKADKVANHYYLLTKNHKAKFVEMKAMNPEQRTAYIKNIKLERKNALNQLVKDGVITKQDAENIAKTLSHKKTK